MRLTPNSTINLYRGVEIDNGEQLAFSSRANQIAYFQSKLVRAYAPCTMIRKRGSVRVEISGNVVSTCNYISFVNPDFDNKTIYARIIDYDYVNNECTEITYVIDYWQTWMFDVQFEDMYIEREHLSQEDFNKSEINPYDPTIFEFRTLENLPISQDIEKLYYDFGFDNTKDGIYCSQALANDYSINNDFGMLIILSEFDLAKLDSGYQPSSFPSAKFVDELLRIQTIGASSYPVSFYKLSDGIYNYLHTNYSTSITSPLYRGSKWINDPNLGPLEPFTGGLKTPLSYIYVDCGASANSDNSSPVEVVNKIITWLTTEEFINNIVGFYAVPSAMALFAGNAVVDGSPIQVIHKTAKNQNVVNKKLDLYPFSYYRLITPNGDVKELKIEDFQSAQNGDDECRVGVTLDIIEKPNLIVAPLNYKVSGCSPRSNFNMNVREGVIFTQFPMMPLNIDSFLAQIAAVSTSIIGNNTTDYGYTIEEKQLNSYSKLWDIGKSIGGFVGNAVNTMNGTNIGAGAITNLVSQFGDITLAGADYDINKQRIKNEFTMSEDAYKTLAGDRDNAVYANYQCTKPAFACNYYHPMNGDGVINYNQYNFMDVIFMRVSINPTILQAYDQYFTNYGYSSGRCGIPRIINYIHDSAVDSELPSWLMLNNKEITYIKTLNCKITYAMLPVADAIKSMFDSGVRMIKGDLS